MGGSPFYPAQWFDSLAELVSSVAHRRGSDSGGHTRSGGGRENGLVFGVFEHNLSCRLHPRLQRLLGNLGGGLPDQPHVNSGIKGGVSSRGCALVSYRIEMSNWVACTCHLDPWTSTSRIDLCYQADLISSGFFLSDNTPIQCCRRWHEAILSRIAN